MAQNSSGRRHEVWEKNGDNKADAVQEGCDATDSRKHRDVGFALQDAEPAPDRDGVARNVSRMIGSSVAATSAANACGTA
jgi:hypothetical protein